MSLTFRHPISLPSIRILIGFALLLLGVMARASVTAEAGPYRIELSSQPAVIALGKAKLTFEVTDAAGKPLDDLTIRAIAGMPGMFMGEREQTARPVPGSAGTYAMEVAFPMAGSYNVDVKISGAAGEAAAKIPVRTGQNLGKGTETGFSIWSLLPWLAALGVVVFALIRMRATGQKLDAKAVLNRGTLGGLVLLAVILWLGVYAVNNWRRPGAMTPLEAQVMEMNTPAPPGASGVKLGIVERKAIAETVTYAGQAVGFVEQDVVPRVAGTILSMPVYVGDRVRKGQILAQLDTTQVDPMIAERSAMANSAARGIDVASADYTTALSEVAEARSMVAVKRAMVAEADSMIEVARQDKAAMDAELSAAQSMVADAQAEIESANAGLRYWDAELERRRSLFQKGFISGSALQESERSHAEAQAMVLQAQQARRSAEAKVSAARANVRRAESMITASQRKKSQADADVRAAEAAVKARESAAEAARKGISREQANLAQALASVRGAATEKGYSELKSEVDGVVTQRLISPGTLVQPGQVVLRVAQVSPIRLQANVASSDLARIRVGATAHIRLTSSSGEPLAAKVTSVAPMLDSSSRTGIVEVLWPNRDRRFNPGEFLSMEIEVSAAQDALTAPVAAIQRPPSSVDEAYVWVADAGSESGRFTVRRVPVQTGISNGREVEIVRGLSEGQRIVIQGGAYLRDGGEVLAEVEKVETAGPMIEVSASGFKPDSIEVEAGKPTTITFLRISEEGCGTEVLFPDLGIEEPLPLNKPTKVTITPKSPGTLRFSCGMDMLRGTVVVR